MRNIITVLFWSGAFILTSCKKEGCTDSDATNYDPKAKENDNSCSYQAKTSFWFNQSKSNAMITLGFVTELTVYIDEKDAGKMDPADWKPGPDCDGANFTITNNFSGDDSETFNYSVRDQNGAEISSGSYTCSPDDCINIQL